MAEFKTYHYFLDLFALSLVWLPLYHLTRWPLLRRVELALAGGYLLFTVAPRMVVFYLLFWLVVWGLQNWLAATPRSSRELWLALLLVLLPMVLWKILDQRFTIAFNLWSNLAISSLAPLLEEADLAHPILPLIGVSFAVFRALDLLIQTHLRLTPAASLDRVLAFGFFPPVQIVGPICEYQEVAASWDRPTRPTPTELSTGLWLIGVGAVKVFLLAALLQPAMGIFTAYPQLGPGTLWVGLLLFAWYFYLNFAGYSDIAIGIGRLYGFTLKENFHHPFIQTNPQAFWANWHMSLTRWVQRNVFIPLGGMRKATQYRALFGSTMVVALWHDLSLSLVIFGLYHSAGMLLYRWNGNRLRAAGRIPRREPLVIFAKRCALFLFVTLAFPLVMLPLGQVAEFYLKLVGG